jgi:hypothetical protein
MARLHGVHGVPCGHGALARVGIYIYVAAATAISTTIAASVAETAITAKTITVPTAIVAAKAAIGEVVGG